MRRLILLLSSLLFVGCQRGTKYVQIAEYASERAVMIYVPTVVEQVNISIEKGKLSINRSTATVQISGAGVYITPLGHILTCEHLFTVGEFKDINVKNIHGTVLKAKIIARDSSRDLALLQVPGLTPYVTLASPLGIKVGLEVFAVGNPLGLEWTVSHGIISALSREAGIFTNLLQTDTFINHGNSGGPLFNMDGELIGINSRIMSPVNAPIFTGLGFSVPVPEIREFLSQFYGLEKVFN